VRRGPGSGIGTARDILTATATGMIAFTGFVVASVVVVVQFVRALPRSAPAGHRPPEAWLGAGRSQVQILSLRLNKRERSSNHSTQIR
jgi:uncharacterized membrane protein